MIEKGTTNGIITDIDGKFTLEVAPGAVVQVSYIGYNTQEVKVGNQSTLAIQLVEDTQALSEVVVVGYGVQRKVTTTGAVTKLEGDEINKMTVVNATKALQGLSPGITVVTVVVLQVVTILKSTCVVSVRLAMPNRWYWWTVSKCL